MKTLRPFLILCSIVLMVGIACSLGGGGATPAQPDQPSQPEATQPPSQPTVVPPTQTPSSPTNTPQPTISQYFREEFDSSSALDNWDSFTLGSGDDTNLVIEQEDDHLLIDMGDEDLYFYYVFLPYEYDDVSLKLEAENRGRNNNNVSLVCRMNEDGTQWYEFSVESGGLWYLYGVDDAYNIIDNGGTNALKQGREVNEYQLVCNGNEITMYVNGDKIKTVTENTYGFNRGLVGFNISSLNVLPITVEVNWFEISEP
jgi:hypothetical protein